MNPKAITLAVAQGYASNWNAQKNSFISNYDFKAVSIPDDILSDILDAGAKGIRVYMGLNETGTAAKIMVVGVDKNDDDLIDEANGHYIYNFLNPCPPFCGTKKSIING